MRFVVQIMALVCFMQCREVVSGISNACLDCIWQVESNKASYLGCNWDVGSIACGPFQIHHDYYKDCTYNNAATVEQWQTCTKSYSCARTCVINYMKRYGGWRCGNTCEDYARMHNGGPVGCSNSNTDGYWNLIKNAGCSRYS